MAARRRNVSWGQRSVSTRNAGRESRAISCRDGVLLLPLLLIRLILLLLLLFLLLLLLNLLLLFILLLLL